MTTTPHESEDDQTIAVDRAMVDEADHTVAVDRVVEEDDHTIAVRSDADEGDHTIAVGHAALAAHDAGGDDTIAVTRARFAPSDEATDATIAVERGARKPRLTRPESGPRRRGIKPPPVPEGFAPLATEGIGPWGVEEYAARSIIAPPAAVDVDADASPPRVIDPRLRSVHRHSRRVARSAITAFVISCLVLAGGIGALVFWLVS